MDYVTCQEMLITAAYRSCEPFLFKANGPVGAIPTYRVPNSMIWKHMSIINMGQTGMSSVTFFFQDENESGIIEAFSTPAHSIAKVIVQATGELDYGTLFLEGGLLYSPMAYILFIVFIVLMPILFNNLLVSS